MSQTIRIDKLNEAISAELNKYNKAVVTGLKKSASNAMNELVKVTKETAPVGQRKKHYRDSITSKTVIETETGITKVWYVKAPNYRLSHLLNNGHALRNGGRVVGTNFIGRAVDTISNKYVKEIEEVLKSG